MLAGRPDVRAMMPEMPAIPSLSSAGLVENLLPGRTVTVPLLGIDEAITQAAAALRSQVRRQTQEYIAARQGAERDRRPQYGDFMAGLGGADSEILAKAPRERARFVQMAGVLLTTAGIAILAMIFALHDG